VTQGVAFETESRKRAQRRLRLIDAANCRGSNGVTKNDRLSMGSGARRFFERAKRRISIDGRCITSNNSIVLHSAVRA
jgi:hypothetical protein